MVVAAYCFSAFLGDMGVEEMRHSSKAFCVCVLILLGLVCIGLVAGCDNSQESAYKSKVASIHNRWNEGARLLKTATDELLAQMNALTKISDPNAAINAFYAAIDTFTPKFQQNVALAQGLQAELNQLQPPAKYATEHKMLVNGMSTVVISLLNENQAVGAMRTINIGALQGAVLQENTAMANIKQGIDNLNLASKYLFPINWALIIGVLVGLLGASIGLGFWTGKLGERDGRSFKAYFCLGFFLWFLGLAIAYFKTRRRLEPRGYGGVPAPSYYAAAQGHPPPAASLPGDLMALENPFGLPDQSTQSMAPQADYAQPQAQQASTQVPPVRQTPGSTFGHCPTCGVELPQAGAFCLRCGSSLPQFEG